MSEITTGPTGTADTIARAKSALTKLTSHDAAWYLERIEARMQQPNNLVGGAIDHSRDRETLRSIIRDLQLGKEA